MCEYKIGDLVEWEHAGMEYTGTVTRIVEPHGIEIENCNVPTGSWPNERKAFVEKTLLKGCLSS